MASRRARIIAICFGAFVFLGISALLARALVGSGAERAKVVRIVQAQARGDEKAVLAEMPACRRSVTCARLADERTARLRRPGRVQILNFRPSTQAAFTNSEGSARVAWRTTVKTFPVVQCVFVRREGPLSGGGVEVVSISNPVGLEAKCGA
jgi:hypothetical protein